MYTIHKYIINSVENDKQFVCEFNIWIYWQNSTTTTTFSLCYEVAETKLKSFLPQHEDSSTRK